MSLFTAALALAAALRLWGIAFSAGSPIARPDEEIFTSVALKYFAGPVPYSQIPGGWPDGFFRIVHGLQRAELVALEATFDGPINLGCLYAVNPAVLHLPPRLFSAACGILACIWLGFLVRRLAPPESRDFAMTAGILAFGCNYLVARDAHFGVSDAALSMSIALATYFCVRAILDHPAWLLPAGFVAGAGFAVKYAAAPFIVPASVAAVVCVLRAPSRRQLAVSCAAAAVLCAFIGFRTLAPTVAESPSRIVEGVRAHDERWQIRTGIHPSLDPEAVVPSSVTFYITTTLPVAFGWFGLGMAALGLARAVRRNPETGAVLVAGTIAFFLPLVGLGLRYVRYASPIVPFLAAALGLFLCEAALFLRARFPGWRGGVATAATIALALVPPAFRLAQFDRVLSQTDTRDLAAEWLTSTAPNGLFISSGYFERIHGLQPLAVSECRSRVPAALWRRVPQIPASPNDWRQLVTAGSASWSAIADRSVRGSINRADPLGANFVALTEGLLSCGRPSPIEGTISLNPRCFRLEKTFSPGVPECEAMFDLFDRFWVPFAGFRGQERPGPRVTIYRNSCIPAPLP